MGTAIYRGSEKRSNFLSLPTEVQTLICQHYYSPWSIVFRGGSFYAVPVPDLPDLDSGSRNFQPLFQSSDRLSSIPNLNLLLTCRAVYELAHPMLKSSYAGKVALNLAESFQSANVMELRRQYKSLLQRTHTLVWDVSRFANFAAEDFAGLEISNMFPNARSFIIRDAFKCINTDRLFMDHTIDPEDASNSPHFADMVEAVVKRRDREKHIQLCLALLTGSSTSLGVFKWRRYEYTSQFQITGLEGIFARVYQMIPCKEHTYPVRQLGNSEIADDWWQNGVDEVDMEARQEDICVIM